MKVTIRKKYFQREFYYYPEFYLSKINKKSVLRRDIQLSFATQDSILTAKGFSLH